MKNSLFNIDGKVVLITGGYGILGSQMAEYLASEGAKVVILGRSKEKGEALATKIKAKGDEAMFLVSDAMNEENLVQNREEILKAYGKIDVLINAAGGNMPGATIPPDKTIFDVKVDAFKDVIDRSPNNQIAVATMKNKMFSNDTTENCSSKVLPSSKPYFAITSGSLTKASVCTFLISAIVMIQ